MTEEILTIEISRLELIVLKKLALICAALGQTLSGQAAKEQRALTSVLVDVLGRVPDEEGPTDDQTYNGIGMEGGVRYGK